MIQEQIIPAQLGKTAGQHIGFELGAKMVKDFQDNYPNENIGFYVGSEIIENILAQPGCVGIKMFNAIDENGNKTMVFVGLDETGRHIFEYKTINNQGQLVKKEGIVADRLIIIKPKPTDPPPTQGGGGDGGDGSDGDTSWW